MQFNSKQIALGVFMTSALGGLVALGAYKTFFDNSSFTTYEQKQNYLYSNYLSDTSKVNVPAGLNFVPAAEFVRPTVVHIKTAYEQKQNQGQHFNQQIDPFLREFFGDQLDRQQQNMPPQEASGSGVILSADGYIVTNNHVIDKADKIKVVLEDKRTYEAKLIGKDPTTDLALLKIEEKDLPFVTFANSDNVRIGEWVLAVGNPFDLTSTVTAGIVSAKARNINIIRSKERLAIESFIQTDAAVNPGNSGGALVDLKGRLIGINTAIATPTGTFAGYSFAIPAAIVEKVVEDLKKHGEVQRGLLGINIQDITSELAKEKSIGLDKGVYVAGVNPSSAAEDAGLKEGDVILKIEDAKVNTSSELQEAVGRHRPGDKVKITYSRNGKEMTATAILKNKMGTTNIVKIGDDVNSALGADFKAVSKEEAEKLKIHGGVKITNLKSGKLKDAGVKEGYIITHVDKEKIRTADEIRKILEDQPANGVLLGGIYPDGKKQFYAIGW